MEILKSIESYKHLKKEFNFAKKRILDFLD